MYKLVIHNQRGAPLLILALAEDIKLTIRHTFVFLHKHLFINKVLKIAKMDKNTKFHSAILLHICYPSSVLFFTK